MDFSRRYAMCALRLYVTPCSMGRVGVGQQEEWLQAVFGPGGLQSWGTSCCRDLAVVSTDWPGLFPDGKGSFSGSREPGNGSGRNIELGWLLSVSLFMSLDGAGRCLTLALFRDGNWRLTCVLITVDLIYGVLTSECQICISEFSPLITTLICK